MKSSRLSNALLACAEYEQQHRQRGVIESDEPKVGVPSVLLIVFTPVHCVSPHQTTSFPLAIFLALCQYVDMVCIYCGSKTTVMNSRAQKRLLQTWRRRQCMVCGALFTTHETADLSSSLLVKHPDGHVEPFSRDKLFVSILRAVGHRQAPVEDARAITSTSIGIILHTKPQAAIATAQIAQYTHQALRRFDIVAGIQYLAYHPSAKI